MNLVMKKMCLEAILKKFQITRAAGYKGAGGPFLWKTTNSDYATQQKPLYEGVKAEWLKLPLAQRQTYGCSNTATPAYPAMSTSKAFLSKAKTQYLQFKNT